MTTDRAYFDWAKPVERLTGWAEAPKFTPYLAPTDRVVDFGCGAGYFLKYLLEQGAIAEGVGIDISEAAREEGRQESIVVHASAADIPDDWADAVISNNALEHTEHPLAELRSIYPKVRPGGRVIFRIPCEHIGYRYQPGDVNHHLYSWSPMAAGNLFTDAGFEIEAIGTDMKKWPPRGYQTLARLGGRRGFDLVCEIYGRLRRSWFFVIVVARRPA
jgi:SAM-dependent methyltransferase